MNYKKYKGAILWMAYMGAILYILPYLMHGHTGYYLLRLRGGFLIYLLAPIIAYGIYHLGIKNISKIFKNKLIITILALILIIGVAIPAHGLLKEQLSYEHIPEDKYGVMLWVQENVPENENLLVLEGDYQLSGTYFKRNRFTLDQEQLITYLTGISQGQNPEIINGFWSGYADWGKWSKRTGYFSFEKYEPLSKTQQMTDFNYIFMEHLSPEIGEINGQLVAWLTQQQGYETIYNQGRFTILAKQNGN